MTEWFLEFWSIHSDLIFSVGINILLAISIYVTLSCGMLAMGNAAFMSIGAYASAIVTNYYGLPFSLAIAFAVLLPMAISFVLGKLTLRLSGVYLAMATLAFTEVVSITIRNGEIWVDYFNRFIDLLGVSQSFQAALRDLQQFTGGALGIEYIETQTTFWHILLAIAVCILLLTRLRFSRLGRAMNAIKEDEVAAGLMGIPVERTKMFAFLLSSAIAGLAGALSAHYTSAVNAKDYGFDKGVEILTMTIFGGVESIIGPILGSMVISLLPEMLRFLSDWRLMVNGLILVLFMIFLPKGIWSPSTFRRWLRNARRGASPC